MIPISDNNENIVTVINKLLLYYKAKVTKRTIIEFFNTYPGNLSLKSIFDFFSSVNISNYALKIDKSDIFDLDDPFIAYINENSGKLFLVYSIRKDKVIYSDSPSGKKTITTEQFLNKWDGVIIGIEPDKLSGENEYSEKVRYEIVRGSVFPLIVLVFSIIVIYGIIENHPSFSQNEPVYFVLLFLHVVGLFFSLLLFRKELNFSTKFIEKFCHISTKFDCNTVIQSNASKVFGIITWADIGVVYFAGGLIILILSPYRYTQNLLILLTISSIPYSIFSVLYQYLKLKKWCPLCLLVQFILLTEFIVQILYIKNIFPLQINFVTKAIFTYIIVFLFLILYKLLFISDSNFEKNKYELLKLKRDPSFLEYKLKLKGKTEIPVNESSLLFGNLNSTTIITVFLSLNCSSCAAIFREMMYLLDKNINVGIQIVFSSPINESLTLLLKTIFRLKKNNKDTEILKILNSWYSNNQKKRFELLNNYSVEDTSAEYENFYKEHSMLFNLAKIIKVPSIYINGYHLPELLSLKDISYHLSELELKE